MTDDAQYKAFCARLDSLEKMATEREERNKERFASREEAARLARDAANEAAVAARSLLDAANTSARESAAKLESINEQRYQSLEKALHVALERLMPKDVYEVQHAQLNRQVEVNTGRLYDVEKFISSQRTVKQEEREKISTTYYALMIAGVIFAVATSAVTVWYNISTFQAHIKLEQTANGQQK